MEEERIKNILRALDKEAEEHPLSFMFSARRHYVHTLFEALSADGRKEFEDTQIGYYLNKRQQKIDEAENRKIKEINKNISEVIEVFKDPKSGMRQKARKNLFERFASQDWKTQIKILDAMVQVGTLADIEWVVAQVGSKSSFEFDMVCYISEQWGNDFKQKLHDACIKYLSYPKIATYLVETADQEFIKSNQPELEKAVGYYKIALNLAKLDRTYQIERNKLDFFQYLDILAKTDRPIKKTELWDEFIVWLLSLEDNAEWTKGYRSYSGSSEAYDSSISILDLRQVDWMVRSCKKMGLFDVVCAIYELDNHIRQLVETIPMQKYDFDLTQKNCQAFLDMAKIIAWKFQPTLQSDTTVESRLMEVLNKINKIGIKTEKEPSDNSLLLTFKEQTCFLHFDERTNNYYFSKNIALKHPISETRLSEALSRAKQKYHKSCSGAIVEDGCKLKSAIYNVPHRGHSHIVFKSELLNFLSFCKFFQQTIQSENEDINP